MWLMGNRTCTAAPATRSRASPCRLVLPRSRQGLAAAPARSITLLRETIPEQHMALLEVLIRAFCQPSLVLDERHDLVEVIGDITPYCRLPEGRLTTAAQSFLRPELRSEARALFLLTPAVNTTARSAAVHLEDLDQWVRLELRCLAVDGRSILLLSFVPQGEKEAGLTTTAPPGERDAAFDREIQRLERELLSSQETLQRSLMELEQANADLESFSEELQASSEELQSSNEELEASNEEMQVTNQELATLNQTLSCRGEQLERLNADLENIQSSLSQGMVIVDRQLCVTRFTPLAVRVFALMASDLGKPLLRIPTTLPLPQLPEALEAVLQGEPRQSLEASSEDVSYLIQVLPYQDLEGRRRGAIVTLTDVSELMEMSRAAEAALNEFSSLTDALDAVVWKWNQGMSELLYVSQRIHSLTGWSPAELCEHPERFVKAIVPDDRGRVEAARDWTQGRWTVRYRLTTRSGRPLWVVEAGRVVKDGDDRFVVGTLTEVTPGLGLGERAGAASQGRHPPQDGRSPLLPFVDERHRPLPPARPALDDPGRGDQHDRIGLAVSPVLCRALRRTGRPRRLAAGRPAGPCPGPGVCRARGPGDQFRRPGPDPLLSHGRTAGFIGGWCAWVSYLALPSIEVMAVMQYLASSVPWLTADGGAGQVLSGAGLALASLLLVLLAWFQPGRCGLAGPLDRRPHQLEAGRAPGRLDHLDADVRPLGQPGAPGPAGGDNPGGHGASDQQRRHSVFAAGLSHGHGPGWRSPPTAAHRADRHSPGPRASRC